jgi:drug/metabolite transporter (DMT)-like permease
MATRDWIALLVLGAIWGGSFIFMRIAAPEFGIYALVEIRTLLATLVLLPFLLVRGGITQLVNYWQPIALIGAVNTAIPFVLFNFSSLHLQAGVNAILNATAPMFGAIVAFLWLGDRLTRFAISGLVIGFAGVALISAHKVSADQVSMLPVLTALLATFCYGLAASIMKKSLAGVKPIAVACGSQVFASILILPLALAHLPAEMPSALAWWNAGGLAILGTGFAYILYFYLIAATGPAKAISVAYLVPLFGVIWGLLFLQETLSLLDALGGMAILFGVAMTTGVLKPKQRP